MDVLVAYMDTCEGLDVWLVESVYIELVEITEYLLGLSKVTEEFDLWSLKCVALVVDRIIIAGEKGVGSFLSGGSFEGASDGEIEGIWTR